MKKILNGWTCAGAGLAVAGLSLLAAETSAAVTVDAELKPYAKEREAAGQLNSVGSDTLNNLMTYWSEGFSKLHPKVKFQVEGKGSSTAPPALIAGTSQLGPMSRQMKSTEVDQFEQKFGYKPTFFKVSLDALGVFVHKDNPLQSLTMKQVDAIFSKTRKGGYPVDIRNWGQVELTGDWAMRPISLYGRNSASGTYGYFQEHALSKGDYKETVKEQPGSAAVVQGVTEDRFGIGYSGVGYITSGVKMLALANKDGEQPYTGTYENVLSGKYPMSRYLYIYVNKSRKGLDPAVAEFIKFVLSREGQEIVVKDGYLPLPAKVADEELKKLMQ